MKYSEDFSEIIFTSFDGSEKTVPVGILDALKELKISDFQLEKLQSFRYLSVLGADESGPVPPRVERISELVGEDLSDYSISFTTGGGWGEDPYYHGTDAVTKVISEENGYFKFSFGEWDEAIARFEAAETDEEVNDLYEVIPADVLDICGMSLSEYEEITLVKVIKPLS